MYYNDNEIVKMGKNNYNNKHDNSEDNKKKRDILYFNLEH